MYNLRLLFWVINNLYLMYSSFVKRSIYGNKIFFKENTQNTHRRRSISNIISVKILLIITCTNLLHCALITVLISAYPLPYTFLHTFWNPCQHHLLTLPFQILAQLLLIL
ncbi:hypothetical protein PUN28_000401 [Cardiocondyla obscurior]|uniref:Uncharacterized protein n=1 Tax=Cardiocondyla obscurior TaxID=286306 RepID=A0AAW2GZK5_9HYME